MKNLISNKIAMRKLISVKLGLFATIGMSFAMTLAGCRQAEDPSRYIICYFDPTEIETSNEGGVRGCPTGIFYSNSEQFRIRCIDEYVTIGYSYYDLQSLISATRRLTADVYIASSDRGFFVRENFPMEYWITSKEMLVSVINTAQANVTQKNSNDMFEAFVTLYKFLSNPQNTFVIDGDITNITKATMRVIKISNESK